MDCLRCGGLLVKDQCIDFSGTSGHFWIRAWRCVNCGELSDPLIEQNRRCQQAGSTDILPASTG